MCSTGAAAEQPVSIDRGWQGDEIVVSLTGSSVTRRCKGYTVKVSVFSQPAQFTVTLGEQVTATSILEQHKPGSPFVLRIQRPVAGSATEYDVDEPLQTGKVDAVDVADATETTIEIRGRDNIAALFDSYFIQEDSFTEATYYDLTAKQLQAVGFPEAEGWLLTGDEARRKAITNRGGGMKRSPRPVRTGSTTVEHLDYAWAWTPNVGGGASMAKTKVSVPSDPVGGSADAKAAVVETVTGGQPKQEIKTLKAIIGQQRYGWLKQQYKRIGLFLWCLPSGEFSLSTPNTTQKPMYLLRRSRDGRPEDNNILSGSMRNDTVTRYSHTLVYGRAGGGKDGRQRIRGEHVDQELIDSGLIKQISYDEHDIKTQKAADALARRYAADARRSARSLTYTVPGHSAASLLEPGKRVPFYVDRMVRVIDQKLGIDGLFYLGELEFTRTPESKTRITLYWPEDLVFAEES